MHYEINRHIPGHIADILDAIVEADGETYIVGGAARDLLFNQDVVGKDLDIEVFGVDPDKLSGLLSQFGEVDQVGASFGVYIIKDIKFNSLPVEFAIPRAAELLTGKKHTDFDVELDPNITYECASLRRDLTINSIGIQWSTGEVIDPHGGIRDWKQKVAREVDCNTFADDHLRTLRAAQFIARFGLDPHPSLVHIASMTEQNNLSKERIHAEWEKLLMKSKVPSAGIRFLSLCGWLPKYYPELFLQTGIRQEATWHPEGLAFDHTMEVVDAAARLRKSVPDDWQAPFMYGALAHDCGKIDHTFYHPEKEKIVSYNHAGSKLPEKLLHKITGTKQVYDRALWIVRRHMDKVGLSNSGKDKTFRKFVRKADSKWACWTIMHMFYIDDQTNGMEWTENGTMRLQMIRAMSHVYAPGGVTLRKPVLSKTLMRELDLKPGPKVGKAIARANELFDLGYTHDKIIQTLITEIK